MRLFCTFLTCHANDNDAMIPEIWANESLAILYENMVMARLVHRDFSMNVANFGDIVNTRRPSEFATRRKTDTDNVTAQDAVTTNVPVPLDQHVYVTFVIKDGESSKSFQDLVDIFLAPATKQIARSVDRILLGQAPQFLTNKVGRLEEMTSSTAQGFLIDLDQKMNENKAHMDGRNLILAPAARASMLGTDLFVSSDKRGDGGTALETADLGLLYGFQTFMDQNTMYRTRTDADTVAGTQNAGASPGDTGNKAVTVTGDIVVVGEYVWITGEGQAHEIQAETDAGSDTTGITLYSPYVNTVSANAAMLVYQKCDATANYAAGYAKGITLDGITANKLPVEGQILAFGTSNGSDRHVYRIIETLSVNTTSLTVWLDRPLSAAVADNDLAFPGPAGSYNLAFHRNALALVSRPLALPDQSHGVRSGVAAANDVAMRITMQYDWEQQGTVVTVDILCGVKVLDTNLGCVLLG